MNFGSLPGGDLVETGLEHLSVGQESVGSLLVSIGAPRLSRAGVPISGAFPDPARRLYSLLRDVDAARAHSRYNALIRRLVSLERALKVRSLTDAGKLDEFLTALGRRTREATNLYLVGGATAVLRGWRPTTIDIAFTLSPDRDEILRAIPELKRSLEINVELAAPHHFIPPLRGWQERSIFVGRFGRLSVYHYDLYAQALAKIERGHAQDLHDVRRMFDDGLIEPGTLMELFEAIEDELFRYPAIDPASFRAAVEIEIQEVGQGPA